MYVNFTLKRILSLEIMCTPSMVKLILSPILKPDAIPTIFNNLPDYHSVSLLKKRKSCEWPSYFDEIVAIETTVSKNKISKISLTLDELKNLKLLLNSGELHFLLIRKIAWFFMLIYFIFLIISQY